MSRAKANGRTISVNGDSYFNNNTLKDFWTTKSYTTYSVKSKIQRHNYAQRYILPLMKKGVYQLVLMGEEGDIITSQYIICH